MKKIVLNLLAVVFFFWAGVLLIPLEAQAYTGHTVDEALAWVRAQEGKTLDYDGVYPGQCVDLILGYYDYLGVPRSSGNGSNYATNTLPAGWSRIKGAIPQKGDILVYTGGDNNYGHVAIFESEKSLWHGRFNGVGKVQHTTNIAYNHLSTPYWGVIRPDWSNDSVYPLIDGKTYTIKSALSGKAIEVSSGNRTERIKLNVWSCTGEPWQNWTCKRVSEGYVFINAYTGQAMDIYQNSREEGAALIQYPYDESAAVQKFRLVNAGGGKYGIISNYNGLAVDLVGSSTDDGVAVELFGYHGRDNQLWTFSPVEEPDTTPPVISNVKVYDISCKGYTVSVEAIDNVEIAAVQFPTWTTLNGQDDLESIWPEGTLQADGITYVYRVNYAEHKYELGEYTTHIYAIDTSGNSTNFEKTLTLSHSEVFESEKLPSYNAETGKVTLGHVGGSHCSFCGKVLSQPTQTGVIALNGFLDGRSNDRISGYGSADVYIDGVRKADDCTDFYGVYPVGTRYEIKDIRATSCHKYAGVNLGSVSGTVGEFGWGANLTFNTSHSGVSDAEVLPNYNAETGKVTLGHVGGSHCSFCGKVLSQPTQTGVIALNGFLDGCSNDGISGYGSADVYVDGMQKADDCTDFYGVYPVGTRYEIKDIRATSCHKYAGVNLGSVSGTVGEAGWGANLTFDTSHSYKTAYVKASPQKDGKATHTCTVCGDKKTTKINRPSRIKLSKTKYTYDSRKKKPSVTVIDSSGKTISSQYYTVQYSGNKEIGEGIVTVKFKSRYKGSMQESFSIIPKSTKIVSVKAKTKGFTVKWKQRTEKTSGYEIQYSKNKKFSPKDTVSIKVTKNNVTSKTVKNLLSGRKYYVRIRAYKNVKAEGRQTKVYSEWSKCKSVITK